MASKPSDNRYPAIYLEAMLGLVRQEGADLSARQLAVLLINQLEDGPHTVRGLAGRLNIAKPAITRALDRLEQFDLVKRVPDPADRRSVLIARTAPGGEYLAYLRRLLQAAAKAQGIEKTPAARAAAQAGAETTAVAEVRMRHGWRDQPA